MHSESSVPTPEDCGRLRIVPPLEGSALACTVAALLLAGRRLKTEHPPERALAIVTRFAAV